MRSHGAQPSPRQHGQADHGQCPLAHGAEQCDKGGGGEHGNEHGREEHDRDVAPQLRLSPAARPLMQVVGQTDAQQADRHAQHIGGLHLRVEGDRVRVGVRVRLRLSAGFI